MDGNLEKGGGGGFGVCSYGNGCTRGCFVIVLHRTHYTPEGKWIRLSAWTFQIRTQLGTVQVAEFGE